MSRQLLIFTFTLILSLNFILPSPSDADVVFDFRSNGNAGGALQTSGTFTSNGITVALSSSTTLGDLTSSFSTNTIGAGVDSGAVTNDDWDSASATDSGEALTLTFTFSSFDSIQVESVDFQGVGSANQGDAALLSVNSGPDVVLETGASDFNGSSDTFSPGAFSSAAIFLSSGQSLTISAEETVSLQNIAFTPIAVPEPASILLFGGYLIASMKRRRRR